MHQLTGLDSHPDWCRQICGATKQKYRRKRRRNVMWDGRNDSNFPLKIECKENLMNTTCLRKYFTRAFLNGCTWRRADAPRLWWSSRFNDVLVSASGFLHCIEINERQRPPEENSFINLKSLNGEMRVRFWNPGISAPVKLLLIERYW